jgi:hypothetical protein
MSKLGVLAQRVVVDPLEARQLLSLSAPTELSAQRVSGPDGRPAIAVRWRDTNKLETGYKIERMLKWKNRPYETLGVVGQNESFFLDRLLFGRNTYVYRVTALSGTTLGVPAMSNPAGSTGSFSATDLSLSATGTNEIRLTWNNPNEEPTSFVVLRRERETDPFQGVAPLLPVSSVGPGQMNFIDYTVRANNSFEYRVNVIGGRDGGGEAWSNFALIKTPRSQVLTLPAAANVRGVGNALNSVRLTWRDTSLHETGYTIQTRWIGNSFWEDLATVGINSTSYTATIPGGLGALAREYRIITQGTTTSAFSEPLRLQAVL